jgi:predicted nucleic acid-binding protein
VNIDERLLSVTRLFVDTAPIIYYVEGNSRYLARVAPVFARLDAGTLAAVTSPITLAECLIIPYRDNRADRRKLFTELITAGNNTSFVPIESVAADKAAELRARFNLSLADALQLAVALMSGCDAFLTNDSAFGRVTDLDIIILEDLGSG